MRSPGSTSQRERSSERRAGSASFRSVWRSPVSGCWSTNEGLMRYAVRATPAAAPRVRQSAGRSRPRILAVAGRSRCRRRAVAGRRGADGSAAGRAAAPSAARIRRRSSRPRAARTRSSRWPTSTASRPSSWRVRRTSSAAIELRLFDRGPYGTQPDALALSRDGSRLYVALRRARRGGGDRRARSGAPAAPGTRPDGLGAERARAFPRRPHAVRRQRERARARCRLHRRSAASGGRRPGRRCSASISPTSS